MIRIRLYLILVVLLCACSLTSANTTTLQAPTATTLRVNPATLVPTMQRNLSRIPTVEQIEATPGLVDCAVEPAPRTSYQAAANLNYAQHAAFVRQDVAFVNQTEQVLEQLVLAVDPNQWPGVFSLLGVSAGEFDLGYELTGRRLVVDLPEPVDPACVMTLTLDFRLQVPQIGATVSAYRGFLGYSGRQLNLGHWLPIVAPFVDGEWIVRDSILIGEQTVGEMADWAVTLNVSSAPPGLEIAGPGQVSKPGAMTWQFELENARDFALSLSEQFRVLSAVSDSEVSVEVYSFVHEDVQPADGTSSNASEHALDVALRSLNMYEDLYGAYPRDRIIIVEGDFTDGMEFSGLVFVGTSFFSTFSGDPASFLTVITVHEVAHQWWYASVASDQAMSPWLDEALATYSEYVFIEDAYPGLKDWWWAWRVDAYEPEGFVDSNVYQFDSVRAYWNAVYLRGARMLDALRDDLGTEAFFNLLRRYYEAGAGQIISPAFFWSLLSADELNASAGTRQQYFRVSS